MSEFSRRSVLAAGGVAFGAGIDGLPWRPARAQAANTIRIGVLTDLSGTFRDINGPMTVRPI